MTLHHRGRTIRDHDYVVTPVRDTTVVHEGGSSAGVLAGLVVALVIVGLIVWALFGSGLFNGSPQAPGANNQPNTPPRIDVNINQPNGNDQSRPSAPSQPNAPANSGGSTSGSNPAPAGGSYPSGGTSR